jgi:hypothetical protein
MTPPSSAASMTVQRVGEILPSPHLYVPTTASVTLCDTVGLYEQEKITGRDETIAKLSPPEVYLCGSGAVPCCPARPQLYCGGVAIPSACDVGLLEGLVKV